MVAPAAIAIGAGLRWAGGMALRWAFAPAAITGRAVMYPSRLGASDETSSIQLTSDFTAADYSTLTGGSLLDGYEPLPEACYIPVDMDALIDAIPEGGTIYDIDIDDFRQPPPAMDDLSAFTGQQPPASGPADGP